MREILIEIKDLCQCSTKKKPPPPKKNKRNPNKNKGWGWGIFSLNSYQKIACFFLNFTSQLRKQTELTISKQGLLSQVKCRDLALIVVQFLGEQELETSCKLIKKNHLYEVRHFIYLIQDLYSVILCLCARLCPRS